jgi:PKD repeat protein
VTATHTYTNVPPLLKTIGLTVTDTVGQTASVSHDVTLIDDPPVAAFTSSVIGYSVSVNAATSTDDHGITSYAWNWGDGSPAGSGVTASHTYTNVPPLLKTIGLTVTDTVGQTASVSQDVSVSSGGVPPIASFTGVTASGGMLTVDASASSSAVGIARYDWNFGDNIIASGVTHAHKYVATGTYLVTLTVTDNNGLTASVSHSFSVVNTALPPLPFTVYGFLTSGGSPIAGEVSVTNVRTGETLIGNLADDTGFFYVNDVMPLYFLSGDTMVVSAVSGALTGSMSVVPDFSGQPFMQVDVNVV